MCAGSAFSQQQPAGKKNENKSNGVKIHQENTPKTSVPEKTNNIEQVEQKTSVTQPNALRSEAKKFCDVFKTYEEPSQFYTVPAHEVGKVQGKAGTLISINPDDLTTLTNQDVDSSIEVELKELINQQQLLKSNAQTVCDGKLLVSGGAYFVNLKSQGQPLKLKPGRGLSIQFPKNTDLPMALFSGYRDSLWQMQWSRRNQVFRENGPAEAWRDSRNVKIESEGDVLLFDTIPTRKPKKQTDQEKQKSESYAKLYAAMEIQNLGWINCDRFYNIPDKTNVSIKLQNEEPVPFTSIYLIFDEINSIVQTHYGKMPDETSNPGFENIPVGAKARLVAFALKGDKMMAYEMPVTIRRNDQLDVLLKEVSEEELKTLLEKK